MNKSIEVNKEIKEDMINKLKKYFLEERDEELGDLSSQLILEFFIKDLGPYIYNKGVEDAHTYVKDKLDDLYALQIPKH